LRRSLVKAVEAGVTGRQDIKQALDAAAAIWNKKLGRQPRSAWRVTPSANPPYLTLQPAQATTAGAVL
jgi:putative chitobiose transport system substrate-binding protein